MSRVNVYADSVARFMPSRLAIFLGRAPQADMADTCFAGSSDRDGLFAGIDTTQR